MITYLLDDPKDPGIKKKYALSYQELKEHYTLFCEMSDDEFNTKLPEIIHFACIVCFLKEVPSYICLSDTGIIHELAHLLHFKDHDEQPVKLAEIRKQFEIDLKLV